MAPRSIDLAKYLVVLDNTEQATGRRNAFEIMTAAATQKGVPQHRTARNRKDSLYNDMLSFCEKHELLWKVDEINTLGVSFVTRVCDVLWYIDGHHHVFASRGCPVPEMFIQFQTYNVPQLSKHRKRAVGNMAYDELETLASRLFRILQSSFARMEGNAI
jgi:hypothetical protein